MPAPGAAGGVCTAAGHPCQAPLAGESPAAAAAAGAGAGACRVALPGLWPGRTGFWSGWSGGLLPRLGGRSGGRRLGLLPTSGGALPGGPGRPQACWAGGSCLPWRRLGSAVTCPEDRPSGWAVRMLRDVGAREGSCEAGRVTGADRGSNGSAAGGAAGSGPV